MYYLPCIRKYQNRAKMVYRICKRIFKWRSFYAALSIKNTQRSVPIQETIIYIILTVEVNI